MNFVYSNEIVFGQTQSIAERKLEEIYKDILINSCEEQVLRRTKYMVKTNLRTIKAVQSSHSSRGYRCSKAYVDVDTSIRMLHEVIYPCMSLYYSGKTLQDSIEYFNY
jgi:hypothetical protein